MTVMGLQVRPIGMSASTGIPRLATMPAIWGLLELWTWSQQNWSLVLHWPELKRYVLTRNKKNNSRWRKHTWKEQREHQQRERQRRRRSWRTFSKIVSVERSAGRRLGWSTEEFNRQQRPSLYFSDRWTLVPYRVKVNRLARLVGDLCQLSAK